MIDRKLFLSDLQERVKNLGNDLREQAQSVEEVCLRLRGEYDQAFKVLDVPKERFVSYSGASRDGDPSLLAGRAGWDHREQAQALATLIVAREQEDGWTDDRLLPLVAGLREILPWVRHWHGEFDAAWGASPADTYEGFLAETTNRLHLTDEALTSWCPVKDTRGRKAKV
ncbi:hypothetical protein C7C45_26020 [Micromonospora arborensis]|uniref:DUF7008 domain-containing protein n=1 Tax=Micromonospora arborensis TaxID=2116518 RepID=A0A318NH61_9ACTN|nr:hypothetical protein [Micromonospora arborensis]PYC66185.1 hypothetical protein C7C45_26020 [Micromonospora arborensis]